jgi:hypothetical protein
MFKTRRGGRLTPVRFLCAELVFWRGRLDGYPADSSTSSHCRVNMVLRDIINSGLVSDGGVDLGEDTCDLLS